MTRAEGEDLVEYSCGVGPAGDAPLLDLVDDTFTRLAGHMRPA